MEHDECMVMQNGFQFSIQNKHCILFLFPGWYVDNRVKYAFAIIGVFFLGLSNGALVYGRQLLTDRSSMFLSSVVYQTYLSLLYGVHMLLAYWIMLLVMTYDVGFFIALLFGLISGHFIFGLIQSRTRPLTDEKVPLIDFSSQKSSFSSPCCQTNH